jgi:hypothetical protein
LKLTLTAHRDSASRSLDKDLTVLLLAVDENCEVVETATLLRAPTVCQCAVIDLVSKLAWKTEER